MIFMFTSASNMRHAIFKTKAISQNHSKQICICCKKHYLKTHPVEEERNGHVNTHKRGGGGGDVEAEEEEEK